MENPEIQKRTRRSQIINVKINFFINIIWLPKGAFLYLYKLKNKIIMEIIFSSFWVFIGILILIVVIGDIIVDIIKALKNKL